MRLNLFRLFLGVSLVLSIPLFAMQLTEQVNWTVMDFIVMGALLSFTGSALWLIQSKAKAMTRWSLSLFTLFIFLYIWAELAVGLFTNLGS